MKNKRTDKERDARDEKSEKSIKQQIKDLDKQLIAEGVTAIICHGDEAAREIVKNYADVLRENATHAATHELVDALDLLLDINK